MSKGHSTDSRLRQRSRDWLKRQPGFLYVETTQHWKQYPRPHWEDLLGFVDLAAVVGEELWLIQVTTAANLSARKRKILSLPHATGLLGCGCVRVFLHGWRKSGGRWTLRVVELTAGVEGTAAAAGGQPVSRDRAMLSSISSE